MRVVQRSRGDRFNVTRRLVAGLGLVGVLEGLPGRLALIWSAAMAAGLVAGSLAANAAAHPRRSGPACSSDLVYGARDPGAAVSRPSADDQAPTLSGVVELVRRNSDTGEQIDSAAYEMLGEQTAFDWPEGGGEGGTASGAAVVALPSLRKDQTAEGITTHIAISNVVPKPGFTDFVVFVYDQHGLLDYVCEKLNEKQTEYIDLARWGYINEGFIGHAIVSAVFWEHDLFTSGGQYVRNMVGLTAALADQPLVAARGQSSALRAVPLHSQLGFDIAPWGVRNPLCPSGPAPLPTASSTPGPSPTASTMPTTTPTPTPTQTPSIPPSYSLVAPEVHLPILRDRGPYDVCQPHLYVQNLGRAETKVALVAWGDAGECDRPDDGPVAVECSGLLTMGGSWSFSTADVPSGARSATVFSLSTEGVPGTDDSVADLVCETLRFGAVRDEDDYLAFKRAYSSGWPWAGIEQPLWGSPVAVRVERNCTGTEGPSTGAVADYSGVSGPHLGNADVDSGRYSYLVPWLPGPESARWWVHVQNAGNRCASARLVVSPHGGGDAVVCGESAIAPGETVSFQLDGCPQIVGAATGIVDGDEPLAIVVDTEQPLIQSSYSALPRRWQLLSGDPLLAPTDTVGYAPLVYKNYLGWTTRLHLQNSGPVTSTLRLVLLDRSGDVASQRELGPVAPEKGISIDVDTLGDLPFWWVGSARVESYPASGGPVTTPYTAEPSATASQTIWPTRTPYTPGPQRTPSPGDLTPSATAQAPTTTPVRPPTADPDAPWRVFIPMVETERSRR